MKLHRTLLAFAVLGTALLADPGTAARGPQPLGVSAEFEGFWATSQDESFGSPFLLQITSEQEGPKAVTFTANYLDLGYEAVVQGKLTKKGKISFSGNGAAHALSRGVGPLGGPDATVKLKFTGALSANGEFGAGTFKNTYKNLKGFPNPFKASGPWMMELDE